MTIARLGTETRVNSITAGNQQNSSIAELADGGYLIVWEDDSSGRTEIKGRRFNADGTPFAGAGDFTIATGAADHSHPQVAGLSGGGFVVVSDLDGDIQARIFDASGQLVALAPVTVAAGVQKNVSVAAMGDGYMVAYTDPANKGSLFSQQFDAAGNAVSAPQQLVSHGFGGQDQSLGNALNPDVVILTGGEIVYAQGALGVRNISGPFGPETHTQGSLNLNAVDYLGGYLDFGNFRPNLTPLENGRYVVTYEKYFTTDTYPPTSTLIGIEGRIYDASGQLVGSPFMLNSGPTDHVVEIAALKGGGFIAVWSDLDGAGNYIISTRFFDGNGVQVGGQTKFFTNGAASDISLVTLADDSVVITWTDFSNTLGDASGSSIHSQVIYNPAIQAMPGWSLAAAGDFNGDGTTDVIWQTESGQLGEWLMKDGKIVATFALNHDMPGWSAAYGDFNGDGTDDLLWNSGDAGVLGVWLMKDGAIAATIALNHDMPGWSLAAAGDFNDDGTTDLMWQSAAGQFGQWLMKDGAIAATIARSNMPGWSVIAVGDFNNDGTSDLILRHANGTVGEWLMGKDGSISTLALPAMPDWSVATTGDINGDGTDDIVWRSPSGTFGAWLMDDGQIAGTLDLGTNPDVVPLTGGDFNNGVSAGADILFQTDDGTINFWDLTKHAVPDFLV